MKKSYSELLKDPQWKKKRLEIFKRDGWTCQICHSKYKTLVVHHINYDKSLTIPQNCCALCNKCNLEVNFNRRHWTKFFQSLLNERYGYRFNELNEPIINIT